jgi:hypothetical protein
MRGWSVAALMLLAAAAGGAATPSRARDGQDPGASPTPVIIVVLPTQPAADASAGPGRVLLRDDFSDPGSGWPRQTSPLGNWRVDYDGGEYAVVRLPSSGGAPSVWYPESFGDFQLEVDGRLLPPTVGAAIFLDIRRQENSDRYSFIVDPTAGTFRLDRTVGGGWDPVLPWTETTALQRDTATNRLGVRAQGTTVALLINGQEVAHEQDTVFREGFVGFGAGSLIDGPADARFDNLVVTSLD